MRIIGGAFRSVALTNVGKGDSGAHLRPTSDRVRESLFNVLQHLDVIEGARVLDLFAGTGALGLEALSRGADHVTFVDDGRIAQNLIRENVAKLHVEKKVKLVRQNVLKLTAKDAEPFGLVFLDPPYGRGLGEKALAAVDTAGWLAKSALIVWEEVRPMQAPPGFDVRDRRKYGDTHVTLLSKNAG